MEAFRQGEPVDDEDEIELRRTAVCDVHGHEVELKQSAARSVFAQEAEIEQSAVALARIEHARIDASSVGLMAARNVEAGDLRALLVLSPSVKGNVRTLFDLRTAFAIGAGFFLARRAIKTLTRTARTISAIGKR